jgi:hypothetical protein
MWQKWETETFSVNGKPPLMVAKANGSSDLKECFDALQKARQQQPSKAAKFLSGQKLLHSFTLFSKEQSVEEPAVNAPQGVLYTNGGFTSLILTDDKVYYYNLYNGAAASNDVKLALQPNPFVDVSGDQSTADYAAAGHDQKAFSDVRANIAKHLLQSKPGDMQRAITYAVDHIRAAQDHRPAQVGRIGYGSVSE